MHFLFGFLIAFGYALFGMVNQIFTGTPTSRRFALCPTTITAGSATTISGVLTAGVNPVAKAVVRLYRYNSTTKHWDLVAVNLTGQKGGVAFVRKPSVTSTFELAFAGSGKLAGTHSGTVTVTVTP